MSATLRPISLHATPSASDRLPIAPATLILRWEISPAALLASPGAAILNGEAPRLKTCSLIWRIQSQTAEAELALELTGTEHHTIPLIAQTAIERTTHDSVESIDAPGLLAITMRRDAAEPTLLFARTPLLADRLALPGGVYDAPTLS